MISTGYLSTKNTQYNNFAGKVQFKVISPKQLRVIKTLKSVNSPIYLTPYTVGKALVDGYTDTPCGHTTTSTRPHTNT